MCASCFERYLCRNLLDYVEERVLIFFASPRLVHHVCDRAEALPSGRWIENAKRNKLLLDGKGRRAPLCQLGTLNRG